MQGPECVSKSECGGEETVQPLQGRGIIRNLRDEKLTRLRGYREKSILGRKNSLRKPQT